VSLINHVDVVSTQFVVGLWLVAAAVLAVVVRSCLRPRPRRALRVSALSLAALLSLVLAAADSVNAHYAYLPTVGDVVASVSGDRQWLDAQTLDHLSVRHQRQAEAHGVIVRLHMPADPATGFTHSIAIAYLPKQYFTDPTQRFPVVYLMHGSPGRAADWFHAGDAGQVGRTLADSGHPTILVAAQLSQGWLDDSECVDGVKEKVESHLFNVVIPTIDAKFRTRADRESRVFAGMSAGGYCALNLGLRHRDTVATIVDMSGETGPSHTGGLSALFGRHTDSSILAVANTPQRYASFLTPDPPTRVWLDSGTSDKSIVREMSHLAPVLTSRGVDVQWRVRPGGHTYWVWTAALQESLPWAICGHSGHAGHDHSRPGPV
jgi:enterochelin esterase-like enzyme